MNADVGTEALGRMTVSAPRPRVASSTAARSLTVRMLRELVCLRPVRWAVPAGVSGGDEGKNRAWCEEQMMKKIVVWGGLLLALGTVSRLLWQVKRVSSVPCDVPLPLPPCMYTYKDVTVSLN
jgi:hypothetical protein